MDDGAPAGWYHDPSHRHELRFWQGDRWTDHVVDGGAPGLDPPTRSGRTPAGRIAAVPGPTRADAAAGAAPDVDLTEIEATDALVSIGAATTAAGTELRTDRSGARRGPVGPGPGAATSAGPATGEQVSVRLTRRTSSPRGGAIGRSAPRRSASRLSAPRRTAPTEARRRPWGWVALAACLAFTAGALVTTRRGGEAATPVARAGQLRARPPAAVPPGTRLVEGADLAIAAPTEWSVVADPLDGFAPLADDSWRAPIAATAPDGTRGLLAVRLAGLVHHPQVDPALFWSDQIGAGREDVVMSPPVAIGVHGYRANQVRILTSDGAQVVTAVDTGDAVFLVSVRAGDQETAVAEFDRVIQTFDLR